MIRPGDRIPPHPGKDFHQAYIDGDPLAIAKARAKYSDELIAAGHPPLDEPLDIPDRTEPRS